MAFIYNLTDSWTDAATTWNGIKLAVTNTASSASSDLLNLTVTGATTASFVVDKSGNLALNGTVNKITMTAPATGATLTLANNSTFITSGAYSSTFTFTGTTTLTFPTSGTVTALGNTTTGTGAIVLASSPSLVTPALGTPSSGNLANCTAYPISALSGAGTGVLTALAVNVGSAGSFVTFNGALGTPSSGNLSNCTGYPSGSLTGLGTGVATALANNVGSAGAIVVQNGVLGTPSSGTLTNATGLPLTTGVTGTLPVANGGTGITSFGTGVATALGQNVTGSGGIVLATSPSLTTPNLGTPSAATLTNATGLPISTGVSGLGSGVATFLATPTSANLASAVTDETGSGPLVFATSPTFTSQINLGTASTTQGSLVLANTSANTLTLKSSNSTAAAYTLTFPAAAPVNGYYLQTDSLGQLSWAAGGGGGGGSPGGSNTQVQFNDAANFGGVASFTFDKTTYTLGLGAASASTGKFSLYNASSVNATSIQAGNASAAVTYTLPTAAPASNGYVLSATTAGVMSWVNNDAGLVVGTSTISGGTSGRVLYDNAGVLGEYSAVPVSLGGTGTSTAFTTGSVVFAGASGTYSQDNTNFFWDNTNKRLGIGTASPVAKLSVAGTINISDSSYLTFGSSLEAGWNGLSGASGYLFALTNGTEKMRLDAAGNLGLGVTPSAWTITPALQVKGASLLSEGNNLYLTANGFYGSGAWTRIAADYASQYYQLNGAHVWRTAASSTAGSAITFTQAMTLDASGNLGLGVSPNYILDVKTSAGVVGNFTTTSANGGFIRFVYNTSSVNGYVGSAKQLVSGGAAADFAVDTSGANNLIFGTNDVERARISGTAATFSIGTSGSVGKVQLYGSTSGSVTLQTAAVAGSNTLTLPASTGTVATTGFSVAMSVVFGG